MRLNACWRNSIANIWSNVIVLLETGFIMYPEPCFLLDMLIQLSAVFGCKECQEEKDSKPQEGRDRDKDGGGWGEREGAM